MSTDRRGFLLTAGAVAAGAALAPHLPSPAFAQAEPPQTAFLNNNPRWQVKPFPLHRVSLAGGTVFAQKRDRVLNYAAAYPADRVLHNFRVTAGARRRPGAGVPAGRLAEPLHQQRAHVPAALCGRRPAAPPVRPAQ